MPPDGPGIPRTGRVLQVDPNATFGTGWGGAAFNDADPKLLKMSSF